MSLLTLVEPFGERTIEPDDLPLTFGGQGASVLLPGARAGESLATLRLAGDRWLLEGAAGDIALQAGVAVQLGEARVCLAGGPQAWRLVVEHSALPNLTLAPLVPAPSLDPAETLPTRLPITPVAYEPPRLDRAARGRSWRPLRWAVGAVAFALLAVIGFIIAATPVSVEPLPTVDLDRVEFGGTIAIPLGERHLVWPGESRLVVEAAGYRRVERLVQIAHGDSQVLKVALERLPGRVRIETVLANPPECVHSAKVADIMLAVPRYGRVKVTKILQRCRISPSKTVIGLSERQRGELIEALRRP